MPFILLLLLNFTLHSNTLAKEQKQADIPTKQTKSPSYLPYVVNPRFTGITINPKNGQAIAWGSDGTIQLIGANGKWISTKLPKNNGLTVSTSINQIVFATIKSGENIAIAVGDKGCLLKSMDGGLTWQNINHPAGQLQLTSLLYHPNENLWFAVGAEGTLIRGQADGQSWQLIPTGLDKKLLSIAHKGPHLIIVGESGLLAVSQDGAQTWQRQDTGTKAHLKHIFLFNKHIIVTGLKGTVLLSKNPSNKWESIATRFGSEYLAAAFHRKNQRIILAGHDGSVLIQDEGKPWIEKRISDDPFRPYLTALFYEKNSHQLIAFTNRGQLILSSDGGQNWKQYETKTRSGFYHVQPLENGIYAVAGDGGFKGIIKDLQLNTLSHESSIYLRLARNGWDGSIILAGELGSLWRSEDAGRNWRPLAVNYPNPKTPPTYRAWLSLPLTQQLLIAGPTGLIMKWQAKAKTWETSYYTPFQQGEAFTHLIANQNERLLVAVEATKGPYVSFDQGKTWHRSQEMNDGRNLWKASIIERETDNLVLVVGHKGIAKVAGIRAGSKDYQWHDAGIPTSSSLYGTYALNNGNVFFAYGANGELWRGEGWPLHWKKLNLDGGSSMLLGMIQESKNGNLVLFGKDGKIWLSDDDGLKWQARPTGVKSELRVATRDELTGDVLIAGRDGVILRSVDSGLNWERLDSHTQANFRDIVSHTRTGNLVAVGERTVVLEMQRNATASIEN